MPKARDLTRELRKLRKAGALPDGRKPVPLRGITRHDERPFAFDWTAKIGWSVALGLFLLQFAVLAWVIR